MPGVSGLFSIAAESNNQTPDYSHSIVAGGFPEMS